MRQNAKRARNKESRLYISGLLRRTVPPRVLGLHEMEPSRAAGTKKKQEESKARSIRDEPLNWGVG